MLLKMCYALLCGFNIFTAVILIDAFSSILPFLFKTFDSGGDKSVEVMTSN